MGAGTAPRVGHPGALTTILPGDQEDQGQERCRILCPWEGAAVQPFGTTSLLRCVWMSAGTHPVWAGSEPYVGLHPGAPRWGWWQVARSSCCPLGARFCDQSCWFLCSEDDRRNKLSLFVFAVTELLAAGQKWRKSHLSMWSCPSHPSRAFRKIFFPKKIFPSGLMHRGRKWHLCKQKSLSDVLCNGAQWRFVG